MDWITDALGAAVVREGERGEALCNAPAQALLAGAQCPSLLAVLRRVLGSSLTENSLLEALQRARAGKRAELVAPGSMRVLVAPEADARATLVLIPAVPVDAAHLKARAAAADIAAGVSHELANALGAIAGWARLAQQGQRVPEALELIEKSAESAWQAARTMLAELGGTRRKTADTIDLSAFVEDAARLLSPKATALGAKVQTRVEPGARIVGDRGAAWSIVWNLAANALEAIGTSGGTVELALALNGDQATFSVEDDGPGMSEEQRTRAFEPYFTTKATGTGLGLAMVRKAVHELGGEIDLRSHPGLGTRFTLTFPLAPSASRRASSTKRSSGVFYAETITGRILVVDDDASLREMIAAALAMRGADVVCVGTMEAALSQHGPFGLAIVDLRLPDVSGDVLAARLRAAGITERVLLITGMEPPDRYAPNGEPDGVLRKPFELEDLFERLAQLLPPRAGKAAAS